MKTIIAFGAHPDDVEFGCGGTLLLLKNLGYRIIIVDLTRGEAAKDGANERLKEAEDARKILEMEREILNLGDKRISLSSEHKKEIQQIINKYNPEIVFSTYFIDKHPDHVNTAKLVSEIFPKTIHYFISDIGEANLGVDVSKVYNKKIEALDAHVTQTRPGDVEWTEERHEKYGKRIGVKRAELFFSKNKLNLPEIFIDLNEL